MKLKLRRPTVNDIEWIHECYELNNWPRTNRTGIITLEQVNTWVKKWLNGVNRSCWVGVKTDTQEPVGFILGHFENWPVRTFEPEDTEYVWAMAFPYLIPEPTAVVDNIIVHPDHQGNGYSHEIAYLAWEKTPPEITRSEFSAMPDTIYAAYIKNGDERLGGKYEKVGERVGETGTLILGARVRPTQEKEQ
jgi:hypothetical protein